MNPARRVRAAARRQPLSTSGLVTSADRGALPSAKPDLPRGFLLLTRRRPEPVETRRRQGSETRARVLHDTMTRPYDRFLRAMMFDPLDRPPDRSAPTTGAVHPICVVSSLVMPEPLPRTSPATRGQPTDLVVCVAFFVASDGGGASFFGKRVRQGKGEGARHDHGGLRRGDQVAGKAGLNRPTPLRRVPRVQAGWSHRKDRPRPTTVLNT